MRATHKTPRLRSIYYYHSHCNLDCRHCWIGPALATTKNKSIKHLSVEDFEYLIEGALPLGLEHIKFTGGEPFCDVGILDKVAVAKSHDIRTTFESNATLISKGFANKLKASGASFIAVSLDGAGPQSHDSQRGSPGAFLKAWNGLQALVDAGFYPQVIFTPTRATFDQLEPLVRKLSSLPLASLKVNVLSDMGRGGELHLGGEAPSVEDYLFLQSRLNAKQINKLNFPIILDLPPAFQSMNEITKRPNGWCGIKGILGVLSDGRFSLCGAGYISDDLVFGSLQDNDLAEIWNNNKTLGHIRDELPQSLEGICSECVMKWLCLGKCRAEAYVSSNSLYSPCSFCETAARQGFFPSTRRHQSRAPPLS